MPIKGKTALITGSSRGIGKEIAIAFACAGANVVINYACDEEGAAATVAECRAAGADAIAIRADVRNSRAVDEMVVQTVERFDALDILVNNAGSNRIAGAKRERVPLVEMCDEAIRLTLDSHLLGTIQCSRAAMHIMERVGSGSIVNVSSTVTTRAFPGQAVYAAAKAGVEGFTRALAFDAAKQGIRVNCVRFGWFDSPATEALHQDAGANAAFVRRYQPIGRLGDMGEAAAACVFLASDAAGYFVGQVLSPDGGISL